MHSIYASIIAFDDVNNYVALRRDFALGKLQKNLKSFVFPDQLSHRNTILPIFLVENAISLSYSIFRFKNHLVAH